MAFQIDPGRPPGEIQPLEDVVPAQGIDGPRAMLPLAPAREQQHHDGRQHAGLGHGQHDDIDMNLQDMLSLQQVFGLEQHDAMLEDGDAQLREQPYYNHTEATNHFLYLFILTSRTPRSSVLRVRATSVILVGDFQDAAVVLHVGSISDGTPSNETNHNIDGSYFLLMFVCSSDTLIHEPLCWIK